MTARSTRCGSTVETYEGGESIERAPVRVSDVVDVNEPYTTVEDGVYSPQTTQELSIALSKLVSELPNDLVVPAYTTLKSVILRLMKDREKKMSNGVVEQSIRRIVRKMLVEMNVVNEVDADKMHNQGMMPEGEGLKAIADALGIKSPSHAKGLVTRAIHKAQFMKNLYERDPEGTEELVLNAVYDYIQELNDMGQLPGEPEGDALTKDDIKILADNPEMVADLDSFRVYLQKYIKGKGYKSPYAKE